MKQPITVDPQLYTYAIMQAYLEKNAGNMGRALTLAMCAGVDAGVLGLKPDECPFMEDGMFEFELKWRWGRAQSLLVNATATQGNLL